MKEKYISLCLRTLKDKTNTTIMLLAVLILGSIEPLTAQVTYTLGTGTFSDGTLGVSPFATINRNQRSQYIITGNELQQQGVMSGNIVALGINVTVLGLPSGLNPENINIKMGPTSQVTVGTSLVENLATYYSASTEDISTTGWHMFSIPPYEWDGYSNIIVEICRSNVNFGTSFEVETTIYNPNDYRTTGLYTNDVSTNGCSLTGTSMMSDSNRRIRPNFRIVTTNPCDGAPIGGVTAVSAGPYCTGAPFTLTVNDGSIQSGLQYQWQSSPNENGPYADIDGANNTSFVASQSIATWYRRSTICLATEQGSYSTPILVSGTGCYCTALVVNTNDIGITNVTFNTINNSSPSTDSYSNFTSFTTTIKRSSTFALSARVSTAGGVNRTRAWIDWNGNGEYETSEGYDLGSIDGGTDTGSGVIQAITVPSNAVLGATTMRIRTKQDDSDITAPLPCGPIENGEAEDYGLVIEESLGLGDISTPAVSVILYQDADGVQIKMQGASIAGVSVYDLSGRTLSSVVGLNTNQMSLPQIVGTQVLIFRITTTEGEIIFKKVVL